MELRFWSSLRAPQGCLPAQVSTVFVNNSIILRRCFLTLPTISQLLSGGKHFKSKNSPLFSCPPRATFSYGRRGVRGGCFLGENHFGHFAIVTHLDQDCQISPGSVTETQVSTLEAKDLSPDVFCCAEMQTSQRRLVQSVQSVSLGYLGFSQCRRFYM